MQTVTSLVDKYKEELREAEALKSEEFYRSRLSLLREIIGDLEGVKLGVYSLSAPFRGDKQ